MKSISTTAGVASVIALSSAVDAFVTLPLHSRPATFESKQAINAARMQAGASTGVPLKDFRRHNCDLEWYIDISVGTPPQKLTVVVDTGSYDLLFPDETCQKCGAGHSFNGAKSKTFSSQPGQYDRLDFGTGIDTYGLDLSIPARVQGTWRTDSVTIGNVTVPKQQFLHCESYADFFSSADFDGIMGFSLKGESGSPGGKPWFWSAVEAGKFGSSAISLHMPADQLTGGEITLGGSNPARYQGDIHYFDTYQAGGWIAPMPQVYVNGKAQNLKEKNALFDSGTPFMSITKDLAEKMYAAISPIPKQLNDFGDWGAPCDKIDEIAAEFTFTFGAGNKMVNATIPKSAFNLGPHKDFPGICQTVLSTTNYGITQFMIGAPLLKQYYTVWDGAKYQLGFAQLKK
ncbi:hypothetical protein VHEMI00053 [[Torrubiella] hemipterigena]|uniref:Peptidase A1 domain-containing protein n=1 Tax=[Torrubiella] hemipterigena TaxID=1531966 RepID=A0A0A1T0R0_9HYPO|nr:hypothetical protein VHEMI00053 [[Torrubiella] hemipterigena]